MKLPAYLVRTSYGYAFRLRVPRDLRPFVPCGSVKRSLRGYSLRDAQLCALTLAARYAQLFDAMRQERGMIDKKSLLDTALDGAKRGGHFEIGVDPATGRPTFKTTPDDTPETVAIGARKPRRAASR